MASKKEIWFATSNAHKVMEAQAYLKTVNIVIHQAKIDVKEIQSPFLEEIATFKAKYAFERTKKPIIAEDAGLFIEALNGFPGPYSSYVYKTLGCEGILKLLTGIEERKAFFKAVIAYTEDGDDVKIFVGKVDGKISRKIRGTMGFGFDPIFIPHGFSKTFAQDSVTKDAISHRRRAFEAFATWFHDQMGHV